MSFSRSKFYSLILREGAIIFLSSCIIEIYVMARGVVEMILKSSLNTFDCETFETRSESPAPENAILPFLMFLSTQSSRGTMLILLHHAGINDTLLYLLRVSFPGYPSTIFIAFPFYSRSLRICIAGLYSPDVRSWGPVSQGLETYCHSKYNRTFSGS